MDKDPNTNPRPTEHGAFPVERPVEALLRDHRLVRKLAEAYLNDQSMEARKQAARQMVQALHTHSRLEESIFYPGVKHIDPGMIGHFEEAHLKTDDLVATLQGMTLDEPNADHLVRELIHMAMRHIDEEEMRFFPKLEQAHIDMTPIGLEMQAFEANLIHMQAAVPDQGARK